MSDAPLSHWQRCYLAVEAEVDSDKLRDRIYEARSSLIENWRVWVLTLRKQNAAVS